MRFNIIQWRLEKGHLIYDELLLAFGEANTVLVWVLWILNQIIGLHHLCCFFLCFQACQGVCYQVVLQCLHEWHQNSLKYYVLSVSFNIDLLLHHWCLNCAEILDLMRIYLSHHPKVVGYFSHAEHLIYQIDVF